MQLYHHGRAQQRQNQKRNRLKKTGRWRLWEREMTMGTTTQAYGESRYWDNRYANESGSFDWYQKYQSLAPLINLYVPRHPNQHNRILVVGCGNSGTYAAFSLHPHSPDQMIQISHLIHTHNSEGIGFQNAAFSEGMVDDGYEDVVSIDISSVVVQTMQSKYSNRPHLKCLFFYILNLIFLWVIYLYFG